MIDEGRYLGQSLVPLFNRASDEVAVRGMHAAMSDWPCSWLCEGLHDRRIEKNEARRLQD